MAHQHFIVFMSKQIWITIACIIFGLSKFSSSDKLSNLESCKLGFCPNKPDAVALHFALVADLKVNESAIINIISNRTADDLEAIAVVYQSRYGETLLNDLRDHLTGKFEELVVALLSKSTDFFAQELHHALRGSRDDENLLIDILLTQNYNKLQEIKRTYAIHYLTSLEEDLEKYTTGHFRYLLHELLRTKRCESTEINYSTSDADARKLYHAVTAQYETANVYEFINVTTSRSYSQLHQTFISYYSLFGENIETTIVTNYRGDFARALLAIVEFAKSRDIYIAKRLYESFNDNIDHRSLIRLMIISKDIGNNYVREAVQQRNHVALEYFISQKTYGSYQQLLLALLFA
ncbi:annexin A13 [Microplitis demolitor]|uniref:annexin A13 n=1 Tax=Microplitis demolitor TaxID=69319 RepID=UPI0004CCDB52|nr:annexin A13 [Microplitis demolitor]